MAKEKVKREKEEKEKQEKINQNKELLKLKIADKLKLKKEE
jgi:hypothetical protein